MITLIKDMVEKTEHRIVLSSGIAQGTYKSDRITKRI
jgi:hypothetical protein